MRECLDVDLCQVGERGLLKFVEDLQLNCEVEEIGCYVLCGLDYHESYVWP